jgi:hypothetical protein
LQTLHEVCSQLQIGKVNVILKPKIFYISRRECRGVVRRILKWIMMSI